MNLLSARRQQDRPCTAAQRKYLHAREATLLARIATVERRVGSLRHRFSAERFLARFRHAAAAGKFDTPATPPR